jgi:hypothetical protein
LGVVPEESKFVYQKQNFFANENKKGSNNREPCVVDEQMLFWIENRPTGSSGPLK